MSQPIPYWPINAAAREVGVHRKALAHAISRGDVPHRTLMDGTRIVKLRDAKRYADKRPRQPRRYREPRQ